MTAHAGLSPTSIDLRWEHLRRLTGPHGLFEHALFDELRVSHGYRTDDNARVARERFDRTVMAKSYVNVYENVAATPSLQASL